VRIKIILSCSMCVTIDEILDLILDLLITHTKDLELQAITVPTLLSIVRKITTAHGMYFQAYRVFTSPFLARASNSADSSAS
jgi:hypothetical protein